MKPANWKENRRDRRLAINQTGKRKVVIIMREHNGITLPFVFRSKAQSISTIANRVDGDATIHADEAANWDILHERFLTKRINHEEAYSDGDACTNQAESFFSRLWRAETGTPHHISGAYLAAYASEMTRQWKGYWQHCPNYHRNSRV